MRLPSVLIAPVLLALAGCSSAPPTQEDARAGQSCQPGAALPASEAALPQTSLCIETGQGTLPFTVELAETPEQQARGLMFRTELADDRGMLFPFPRARVASFWMKDTVIPLDLLFIRSDGTIESIAADAIPYDTASHASGEKVIAVLELRGGVAAQRGIAPGDRVRWTTEEGG